MFTYRYREGGYESGFRSIADLVHTPRLLQVKGKRNVRIKQVRLYLLCFVTSSICLQVPLKRESLNLGDVFILDAGEKIYVWTPPESGRLERIKVCVKN